MQDFVYNADFDLVFSTVMFFASIIAIILALSSDWEDTDG